MTNRNRGNFQRRSSPPNRGWSGTEVAEVNIAGNTAVLLATFVLSNAGIDETHLRALASFAVSSDQTATSEAQVGALGMIVVSDQVASVGITAVPHPVTDINDDGWFVHMPIAQQFILGDGTGFAFTTPFEVNSKAKRVIHDGQTIAVVVENATAAGFQIAGIIRMLAMVRGT